MNPETELFKVINVPMQASIEGYMEKAKETIENQIEYITGPIANDVYQFSSLPWVAFTHFSHTLIDKSRKSNPMFDWGKYHEKNGRMVIPFSVQVHHSFVDGFHVGKLVQQLQERLNSF